MSHLDLMVGYPLTIERSGRLERLHAQVNDAPITCSIAPLPVRAGERVWVAVLPPTRPRESPEVRVAFIDRRWLVRVTNWLRHHRFGTPGWLVRLGRRRP